MTPRNLHPSRADSWAYPGLRVSPAPQRCGEGAGGAAGVVVQGAAGRGKAVGAVVRVLVPHTCPTPRRSTQGWPGPWGWSVVVVDHYKNYLKLPRGQAPHRRYPL